MLPAEAPELLIFDHITPPPPLSVELGPEHAEFALPQALRLRLSRDGVEQLIDLPHRVIELHLAAARPILLHACALDVQELTIPPPHFPASRSPRGVPPRAPKGCPSPPRVVGVDMAREAQARRLLIQREHSGCCARHDRLCANQVAEDALHPHQARAELVKPHAEEARHPCAAPVFSVSSWKPVSQRSSLIVATYLLPFGELSTRVYVCATDTNEWPASAGYILANASGCPTSALIGPPLVRLSTRGHRNIWQIKTASTN